ncbi:MAG TPA: hypothetical protein VJ957_10775 [Longimicrobiales bacterium]|nr:hypothetical protein [Longimicrobiales bacterium]
MAGFKVRAVTALVCLALAACSSSPTSSSSGGGNGGDNGGSTRVVLSDPSFSTNIQEIFDRRGCAGSSCHGTAKQANLDLTKGNAYAALVNIQSTDEPDKTRVIPGDTANSYLVIKLEGRQSFGVRMPNGQAPLDSIDMANIKNWIQNGAKNN